MDIKYFRECHHVEFLPVSTCLSPYVHQLVTEHTFSECRDERVTDDQGLMDFDYIGSQLPDESNHEDLSQYFTECVKVLAPMLHSIEDRMGKLGKNQMLELCVPLVQWTGFHQKVLLETWELLDAEPVDLLTVLLVTTAVLERCLGDLYLMKGPAPCPSMLKDLLLTKELSDVLSPALISVLRIFIGPPTSLNLRNLVWHGFPFPGEIPSRCVWFVVLLVPSIGKVLQHQHISEIEHREPICIPNTKVISEIPLFSDTGWMDVVCGTKIMFWETGGFWRAVERHYHNHRYSLSCALLLYYLEHGLRRVFATANKCEHRILTAQATELFTTFDEMLSVELPDGAENKLRTLLGDNLLEILLDHLAYQQGPRIRDRLSHGEASWDKLPWQLVDNIAAVAIYLSAMFLDEEVLMTVDTRKCDALDRLGEAIMSYQVQFHRISVLKTKLLEHLKLASEVDCIVTVLPDLSERADGISYTLFPDCITLEGQIQKQVETLAQKWQGCNTLEFVTCFSYTRLKGLHSAVEQLLQIHIKTLYRETKKNEGSSDPEREILSLLQHIVDECTTVVCNVEGFIKLRQQQLADKQLRSRQRENFKKCLVSFPGYVMSTCFCCFLCCWQLYHLDLLSNVSNNFLKLIKYWKNVLQFCENLRTYSSSDKNKWTEGLGIMKTFIQQDLTTICSLLLHETASVDQT